MCIIVFRKAGEVFPDEDTLLRCWTANRDGGGLMYAQDGTLWYLKGLMSFKKMLAAIKQIPAGVPAALHFRIGTNGANTAANTHPWIISNNNGLVHNGIISWLADDRDVSDSRRLAEVIRGIDWTDPLKARLIKEAIGYNKVVLMNGDGQYAILGEAAGTWDAGCWFSNSGYKKYVYETTPYDHGHVYKQEDWACSTVPAPFPKTVIINPPKPKIAPLDQQLMVTMLAADKNRELVRMRLKNGSFVHMVYPDFVKHYGVYDFETAELVEKADLLAVHIQDYLDAKRT